jgi:hypothetical protein
LLEMARKTGLMAVTSFLQKGSYLQLFAKMLISGVYPNPNPSPVSQP